MARRDFGSIRQRASGRWQARYSSPTGETINAPHTFATKGDASTWLAIQRADLARGEWKQPAPKPQPSITVGSYAETWLEHRTVRGRPLRPRTVEEYRKILEGHILPTFRNRPLAAIRPEDIRRWHAELGETTGPTRRAHAYALLKSILATAVAEDLIPAQPCRIRGAGVTRPAKKVTSASASELAVIVEAARPQDRALYLLAAWCGLRLGEVTELRRGDVDLAAETVSVSRQVQWLAGRGPVVGPVKSDAGVRTVALPPHVVGEVRAHLRSVPIGPDALLFPSQTGRQQDPKSVRERFARAARAADREDLRFHDLRATGATMAAVSGATVAELMARIGHSTPQASMRYQHAASDRDHQIAAALSVLAEAAAVAVGDEPVVRTLRVVTTAGGRTHHSGSAGRVWCGVPERATWVARELEPADAEAAVSCPRCRTRSG